MTTYDFIYDLEPTDEDLALVEVPSLDDWDSIDGIE